LLSKYLETVIATDQEDIERFFSTLAPRQKIREAIHALQAARELSFLPVGVKTLIRMTSLADEPRARNTRVTNKRETSSSKTPLKGKSSLGTQHADKGTRLRG
jgi:hypothetical protein